MLSVGMIRVLLCLVLVATGCSQAYGLAHANPYQPGQSEDAQLAATYCAQPEFKDVTCGWATEEEQAATLRNQCAFCGVPNAYAALPATPSIPINITADPLTHRCYGVSYNYVSLACKGPTIARTVFKILKQPEWMTPAGWNLDGTNCTSSSMDTRPFSSGLPSYTVRCRLEVPPGPGSEAERAVQSKEVECWECRACEHAGGCPSETGVWYSDSAIFKGTGCDFSDTDGYYVAQGVGISYNPGTKLLLAKFEVCNQPGCFDPNYEMPKFAAAKRCIYGKCL